ncbi:MAG: hypothetical protein P8Y97_01745 [Candidatus Lokiarchaeota archaeon]
MLKNLLDLLMGYGIEGYYLVENINNNNIKKQFKMKERLNQNEN